ncbi:MAG: response regulator [Candidatus Brocadiales bacterium]|nr:response regulator [Candidatus Brocadiales bacterium]
MTTILLVEDDKNQCLFYEQELGIEGYGIETANDWEEALAKAQEQPPDLIIMDLRFQMMDGFDSLGMVVSEHGHVPIIINTAYINYKNNLMSCIADAYIVKSSDLTELKNKIEELLKRETVNREEGATKYKPEDYNITVSRREKKRSCLKCGKKFHSKGLHNRICVKCDVINVRTGATTYSLALRLGEITESLR